MKWKKVFLPKMSSNDDVKHVGGRHGSLVNGAPQESKAGLQQGHISINLLFHKSWSLEEAALMASLLP